MKLDIVDVDKIIEVNKLPEITSPFTLDREGRPHPDGLYSVDTFGRPGSAQRKQQFAYVNLKKNFLHPVVFRLLTESYKFVGNVLSGEKYVIIQKNGTLKVVDEDTDGAGTGVDFIYENWDNIKWEIGASKSRREKIELLRHFKKEEIFVRNWLVCPAFYRDIDMTSSSDERIASTDEVTPMYARLINLCSLIDTENLLFSGHSNELRVQNTIYEIYLFFTQALAKKNGIIHKKLLGKAVDFPVRSVISATTLDTERYDEQQIPMGFVGLPLHQCIAAFMPLVMVELENRFVQPFKTGTISVYDASTGKPTKVDEKSLETVGQDYLTKLIKRYSRSHESRLDQVMIKIDGKDTPLDIYEKSLGRKFSLLDMLYIATYYAVQGKYVVTTRYPLEDYRNIVPLQVKIMVTEDTQPMKLGSALFGEFPEYPIIPTDGSEPRWVDSMRMNNLYLGGYGGDFDGDMVSTKALFSVEATEELARLAKTPLNFLDPSGSATRVVEKELIQSFFNFTKRYD